jgi:putative ATP-dependent endonuclease of OLD family
LNDYRQIIRFYKDKGITKIISGSDINLEEQLQKHLYIHFPFIKEAFFARGVIFVEGDAEYASFPHFAHSLSIDLDDLGICIIKASGEKSIPPLMNLANKFCIPSVGIVDKDEGKEKLTLLPNYFITSKCRDFEDEIISLLIEKDKENVLRKILCEYDSQGENREIQYKALNKRIVTYKINIGKFTRNLVLSDIDVTDIPRLKLFYLTWYSINKSNPLGKLIGENLSSHEIPKIYQVVIKKARKLVHYVQSNS